MSRHQVDRVLEEIDVSMAGLRRAIRGMPVGVQGFRGQHDRLARAMAELSLLVEDAQSLVREPVS